MTPSQFTILLERLDRFEEKFSSRLLRVELQTAAIGGGLTLTAILVAAGVIHL